MYAEDPFRNYLPSIGTLRAYHEPCLDDPNVRIDSAVEDGTEISMYYDPMIAKVITKGKTRTEAIDTQIKVLDQFVASGLRHNICLLRSIYANKVFREGTNVTTSFLPEQYPEGFKGWQLTEAESANLAKAAAVFRATKEDDASLVSGDSGVNESFAPSYESSFVSVVNGKSFPYTVRRDHSEEDDEETYIVTSGAGPKAEETSVSFQRGHGGYFRFSIGGKVEHYQLISSTPNRYEISTYGTAFKVLVHTPAEHRLASHQVWERHIDTSKCLVSPMPGQIREVCITPGQKV